MTASRTSISVITVALNSAKHIRHAIESAVAQADDRLQYIVIDGQSTDDTVTIVESFRAVLGSRLLVLSEKDNGLYDAMNKGITLATGEVIGILNSDDRYLPGALSAVQDAFRDDTAHVVYGDLAVTDSGGSTVIKTSVTAMRHRMSLGHPACFVRRTTYRRWGTFDTRYKIAADYDFLLRCYLGGARFEHVARVLATFAAGGASSRSFELAREMYNIQSNQLSTPHALRCLATRITRNALFGARRGLGIALLGQQRYELIRNRWRRLRRPTSLDHA